MKNSPPGIGTTVKVYLTMEFATRSLVTVSEIQPTDRRAPVNSKHNTSSNFTRINGVFVTLFARVREPKHVVIVISPEVDQIVAGIKSQVHPGLRQAEKNYVCEEIRAALLEATLKWAKMEGWIPPNAEVALAKPITDQIMLIF